MGTAINTVFKLTAKWPTSSSAHDRRNKNIVKVENDGNSDDNDEDGLVYHFYYRPNSNKKTSKQGVRGRNKYISLKHAEENSIETVLPGTNEVTKVN